MTLMCSGKNPAQFFRICISQSLKLSQMAYIAKCSLFTSSAFSMFQSLSLVYLSESYEISFSFKGLTRPRMHVKHLVKIGHLTHDC